MTMFNQVFAFFSATLHEVQNRKNEKGVTAVEYALVVGGVCLLVVGALAAFGPKLTTFVNGITF